MYRIAEIKKLLRESDYVPIVQRVGDGCIFTLPHPVLVTPLIPRLTQGYAIKRGGDTGIYYNTSLSPTEKFMSVPEYAIRLLVMVDIVSCCKRLPISVDLVHYVAENGEPLSAMEEIIDPPASEEEQAREGFLKGLFFDSRGEGFPPDFEEVAIVHGVHDGYRLVKAFFEG
jgi:hypothetical protein